MLEALIVAIVVTAGVILLVKKLEKTYPTFSKGPEYVSPTPERTAPKPRRPKPYVPPKPQL